MKRRRRTEIREDGDGYITINGEAWETWTVGKLLDLTDKLGYVRHGSWLLMAAATDTRSLQVATKTYKSDLQREVLAFRALGHLRLMLSPPDSATAPLDDRVGGHGDDASARQAKRLEYVLGCELAGICPNETDIPDHDGVTPREESQ